MKNLKQCALCTCIATGERFGFAVCDYHQTHGESDPECPKHIKHDAHPKTIFDEWFVFRFDQPVGSLYYNEWKERFAQGIDHAWTYMDQESKALFIATITRHYDLEMIPSVQVVP